MDMNVEIHGDGGKPHLLLVHGLLSSRAQWRPNLEALSAVSTPVVVELLGHGRSPSPTAPEAYSVAAYVRRFEALRERLGLERWFVCGQSFGAGLTIRYALDHPGRIVGQVFTNTMSGLSPAARERLPERVAPVTLSRPFRSTRGLRNAFPPRSGRTSSLTRSSSRRPPWPKPCAPPRRN